jgi:protein-S-isoprenylcysteine O-methyltransferase Ste14
MHSMSQTQPNQRDTPGVLAPPPLFFAAGFGLGGLLHWGLPLRLWPGPAGPALRLSGWLIALAGGIIAVLALLAMARARTHVEPYHPTTALVTGGPYRFSRNPIYLAFTLAYLGFSLSANALWPLLLLPGVLAALRRGVIDREERYLERKFGDHYRDYKARVRRWL